MEASAHAPGLIEASLDPLVALSVEGRITDANQATIDVTGVPRAGLIGSEFSTYFTEPAKAQAALQQALRTGSVKDVPLTIRQRQGKLTEVLYNARVSRDAAGQVAGVFAAARDITAQRKAEAAELHTRLRLEEAQVVGHIGWWEWDIPANKIAWSDELYRLYGFKPQEFEASFESFQRLLHPEDRDRVLGIVGQAMKDQRPFEFDHRLVRPDGEVRWLHGRGKVMADATGKPVRMLGTADDITDRKRAEETAEEGRRQLAVAEKFAALGTLVAGVGHEIRTPLTYIKNRAALAGRLATDAAKQDPRLQPLATAITQNLQSVEEGAMRIDRIVQQLRHFAKLDLNPSPVGLHELVAEAVELFRTAKKTECDIRTHLDPTPLMALDRGQLEQVIINLLNNALEAQGTDAVIEIATRTNGRWAEVEVRDHGTGIPPHIQGRIFDPFYTSKPQGTGLGLSISKRIMENHGGTIAFDTVPGKGTVFRLTFPVREKTPEAPA